MKSINAILTVLIIGCIFLVAFSMSDRPPTEKFENSPILMQVREYFGLLNKKYTRIPLREGSSSYTEDKSLIVLCLKDPETGEYYDMNTIMYVALHELAHVISKKYDDNHGPEFQKNFSKLLQAGAAHGIYDPSKSIAKNYCGIDS